jgi:cytidylate kinase
MPRRPIIAIDGPSGAGKGTIARTVAAHLQYRHIDTGAMYRAVAWKAREEQVDLSNEDAVARVARAAIFELDRRIRIDGHDVTIAIRTPDIDEAAATVARHPGVRAALVERQRSYGANGAIVMEGRDIGTVVFPNADVKVYLDASPEERARRRARDPAHTVSQTPRAMQTVAQALKDRDHADRTRPLSPLVVADDAVYIDTTGMAVDEVVRQVIEIVEDKLRELGIGN